MDSSQRIDPVLRTAVILLAREKDWDWYRNYVTLDETADTPKLNWRGVTGYGVQDDKHLLNVTRKLAETVTNTYQQIRLDHEYAQALDNLLGRICTLAPADMRVNLRAARLLADIAREALGAKHKADISPEIQKAVKALSTTYLPGTWESQYIACSTERPPELAQRDTKQLTPEQISNELFEATLSIVSHAWESSDEIRTDRSYDKELQRVLSEFKIISRYPDVDSSIQSTIQHLVDLSRITLTNRAVDPALTVGDIQAWELRLRQQEARITPFKATLLQLTREDKWDWNKHYLRSDGCFPQLAPRSELTNLCEDVNAALLDTMANMATHLGHNIELIRGDLEYKLAFQHALEKIKENTLAHDETGVSQNVVRHMVEECLLKLASPTTGSVDRTQELILDARELSTKQQRQMLLKKEAELKKREEALKQREEAFSK